MKLLAILCSMLMASVTLAELPNDCAITATEAYARLRPASAWTRIINIKLADLRDFTTKGHAVTAWQLAEGDPILIYDGGGTVELDTRSRKIEDIVKALNNLSSRFFILEAHFVK